MSVWGWHTQPGFNTPDAPDAVRLSALAWESRHKKRSPEEFKLFGWSAWKHWLGILPPPPGGRSAGSTLSAFANSLTKYHQETRYD